MSSAGGSIREYIARCREPSTGLSATFQIKALTPENADVQARDGFYGLLGVDQDRRTALEVDLTERS